MIYFYARTDNRSDLDRLRRTVALAKEFEDVYLMTTDFRAASYAKELGIKKAVGIEDFRNISQICQRGDLLVFDSDEHLENEFVHREMIDFFGRFIRISYDPNDAKEEGEILISPYVVGDGVINGVLVDSELFEPVPKTIERLFFWGDADYEKELLGLAPELEPFGLELLLGLYFFAGYDDELHRYFESLHEPEEYLKTLQEAKLVVSASPQSALEAAAAGAKSLYMPKVDESEYNQLLERVGVLNMGMDPKGLQEALLRVKDPDRSYFETFGVKKVKEELEKLI